MKPEPNDNIDRYRIQPPQFPRTENGDNTGCFLMTRKSGDLRIIASSGDDSMPWEHVSVSLEKRCPTWKEMCIVKRLFWGDDEMVVQYHPPESDYVNQHEFCLHLWKPIGVELPSPPLVAV